MAGESDVSVSTGRRALYVFLGMCAIMLDGFDTQAIGLVAPDMAKEWHVPLAAFAPVFSAGLFGSMAGAMLAGVVGNRIGRRNGLMLAVALFGIVMLATVRVDMIHVLSVLRFLVGVGLGVSLPLVLALVADISTDRSRATFVVIVLCGQPIGAILGSSVCAHFIPFFGWQFAFWLGGFAPLLLLPALLIIPDVVKHEAGATGGTGLQDLFALGRAGQTALIWIAMFAGVMFFYVVVSWLPGAMRGIGYTLDQSVLILSVFNAGGIIGALMIGTLVDRHDPLIAPACGFAIAAACLMIMVKVQSNFLLLACLVGIAGIAGYGTLAALGGVVTRLHPSDLRAAAVGWAFANGRLGAATGPLLASALLTQGVALMDLLYFAGAMAGTAALSLALIRRYSDYRRLAMEIPA